MRAHRVLPALWRPSRSTARGRDSLRLLDVLPGRGFLTLGRHSGVLLSPGDLSYADGESLAIRVGAINGDAAPEPPGQATSSPSIGRSSPPRRATRASISGSDHSSRGVSPRSTDSGTSLTELSRPATV